MSDSDKNLVIRKVIKKGGHAAHHGGAWKVAYADFVTAMMALFIVLWIIAHNANVRDSVAQYFRDPGAMHKNASGGVLDGLNAIKPFTDPRPAAPAVQPREQESDRLRTEGEKLIETIAAVPDLSKFKNQIQVSLTKEGLRIELIEQSEGLFFDIGSARMKPDAVRLLKLIASRIGQFPNHLLIEGHTDSRPYSGTGYNNWDLSTDRANAARRVLEEGGVAERQISSVNGYADKRLKNPDSPLDFANRRVAILVTFVTAEPPAPGQVAPAATPFVEPSGASRRS